MTKTVRTKTVEETRIDRGTFVMYQRRKEGVRCACFHDEPDPNRICRECYGVGLDGGYYDLIGSDGLVLPWLQNAEGRLAAWRRQGGRPDKVVARRPTRDVLLSDKDNCALAVLAALPGIGEVKARACLDVWGDLGVALMWLSDPDLYDKDLYPAGIGRKTLENIATCFQGSLVKRVLEAAEKTLEEV